MKKISIVLLLLALPIAGCQIVQGILLTSMAVFKGTDTAPKYDILSKGEIRVAVVPRSVYSNAYELQSAPRDIARQVNLLLDQNVQNKKLRVVEQSKVEAWLDNCQNDFDSFAEVGREKSINADIVIGFDIVGFRIRDPQNAHLIQGKCQVHVTAIEVATGKTLASENLLIVDPPSMPLPGTAMKEVEFRPKFVRVVAEQIASLFHHHDRQKLQRMDVDSLEMHR
jgi:hypothetical protein